MGNIVEERKAGVLRALQEFHERQKTRPWADQMYGEKQGWRKINRERGIMPEKPEVPNEWHAQKIVCEWMDWCHLDYLAVPNEIIDGSTERGRIRGYQSKLIGVRAGVPDLIILTRAKNGMPTALEMKRDAQARLTPNQKAWSEIFVKNGWNWIVGYGADDALAKLKILGYGV